MDTTETHRVLVFSPYALILQPESLVHGVQDSLCLSAIGLGVLANQLCDTSSQPVATIVIR